MFFPLNRRLEFLSRAPASDATTILGAALRYGVQLQPAASGPEQLCWCVVGVHHLLPEENLGKRAVYVDLVDEQGKRIQLPDAAHLRLRWGWEGQRHDAHAARKPLTNPPTNRPPVSISIPVSSFGCRWKAMACPVTQSVIVIPITPLKWGRMANKAIPLAHIHSTFSFNAAAHHPERRGGRYDRHHHADRSNDTQTDHPLSL